MRQAILAVLATLFAGCSAPPQPSPSTTQPTVSNQRPPNVLIILADDLGYGDLGVQGVKDVATPNIDRLAAQGVRFTNYYANHPVCAPSRAALMTGRYQQSFGFENNSGADENAPANYGVPVTVPTIAEKLRARGYATGMFGKWHIGFTPDKQPIARGFDTFYGFLGGTMAYVPDGKTGVKEVMRGTKVEPMPAHTTEAFAAEAIDFIRTNRDKPFMIYLSFNAIHAPMQSTQPYLDRFASEPDPKRRAHNAMLAAMDDAIGKVVGEVDSLGLGERTLVMFSSDNGGPTWQTTSSNGPLNGVKATVLEGGIRVPAIFRWTGSIPAGRVLSSLSMEFDMSATALAVAGVDISKDVDGVDLRPWLTGAKTGDVHQQLYWRSGPQGAMREGKWKYLKVGGVDYLFDLDADLGERNNLATKDAAQLAKLKASWDAWSATMAKPLWGRGVAGGVQADKTTGLVDLIDRYVKGLPVEPKTMLYGGGPEE